MRKIIIEEWMSLDGFVADKEGGLDFFTTLSPEDNIYSDKDQLRFLETVDAIILGRKTYELFVDFWPQATTDKEPIADRLNSTPKYIVSRSLKEASWGKWQPPAIINGNVIDHIRSMKNQDGKNIIVWGSISLVQLLMKEGLADELKIQLCPVILGAGRTLFGEDQQHRLQLTEERRYPTGVQFLHYKLDHA